MIGYILIIILVAILDGSLSSPFASIMVVLGGYTQLISIKDQEQRNYGKKLMSIIVPTYILFALIFSFSFSESSFFMTSDSMRYIQRNAHLTEYFFDWDNLLGCYFQLADNNALYNIVLSLVGAFGNIALGGTTTLYLTLFQTIWGVMTSIVVYRILLTQFEPYKAYKTALIFGLCSQCLFYSSVIIRDIIIVFFYAKTIEIILNKFSIKNTLLILFMVFITWGVRLYSGLFLMVFLFLYLFINSYKSRYRYITATLFVVVSIFALIFIFGSTTVVNQSLEEIDTYTELTSGSTGLAAKLYTLPPGVRHIALFVYSQIAPFPSYLTLEKVESFSNVVMALDVIKYEFYWYLISFSLLFSLVFCNAFKSLNFVDILLLLVAFAFILANTAHPDVRRMLPVYPILLLESVKVKELCNNKISNRNLTIIWVGLLLCYFVIK